MKYGRYSPKCIIDMYSDRNIKFVDRSKLENIKDVLYVHIPFVETEDRNGYMFLIVCPDDVYIISYMNSVIPLIHINVGNARIFMLISSRLPYTDNIFYSSDYKVLISNTNAISINADKLRDYQINTYNAIAESPHIPSTIPNFKKEYSYSFFVDGGIENWKNIISFTILFWMILL